MYVRITKLDIVNGTSDAVIDRMRSDLLGPTSAAPGFVAYYNVATDDSTVYSIRVFEDAATLDAETQATAAAADAIVNDYMIDLEKILEGDVGTGASAAHGAV